MLVTLKQKQCRIWFDDTLCQDVSSAFFSADYWQEQERILGFASGRGKTWFLRMDKMDAALRHYRRGGLFGKLVKDHYLFTGWENTRCYQELMVLFHLKEAGVNVPRPIAAQVVKTALCYKADLISEKVPNARDLVAILQEKSLPDEMYHKIGKEIRKMHDAQVNHTDLNIHNILIDDQDKVWIIDFDKCPIQKGNDWKSGNIERLTRSFNKEKERFNIHLSQDSLSVLLQAYHEEIY